MQSGHSSENSFQLALGSFYCPVAVLDGELSTAKIKINGDIFAGSDLLVCSPSRRHWGLKAEKTGVFKCYPELSSQVQGRTGRRHNMAEPRTQHSHIRPRMRGKSSPPASWPVLCEISLAPQFSSRQAGVPATPTSGVTGIRDLSCWQLQRAANSQRGLS